MMASSSQTAFIYREFCTTTSKKKGVLTWGKRGEERHLNIPRVQEGQQKAKSSDEILPRDKTRFEIKSTCRRDEAWMLTVQDPDYNSDPFSQPRRPVQMSRFVHAVCIFRPLPPMNDNLHHA